MIYEILDVIITLRCNGGCLNCIRFCGMGDITGLDYSDTDMSLSQVDKFISQIEELGSNKPVINSVVLSGGEPTLHKDIKEITKRIKERLLDTGLINKLLINSNLKIPVEDELLKSFIINFSTMNEKLETHNVVLFHPQDMKKEKMTFEKCNHYRKLRPTLSVYGYNMCCAAQGYITLFGLEDLFINYLPKNLEEFPLKEMDQVCQHCPFPYMDSNHYLEKNIGRPVSLIYKKQVEINKKENRIKKRFY